MFTFNNTREFKISLTNKRNPNAIIGEESMSIDKKYFI